MRAGTWLLGLVVVLIGVVGYWYGGAQHFVGERGGAPDTRPLMVLEAQGPCALDESGCRYVLNDGSLRVWVQEPVRPLQPFEVWLDGAGIVEAEIRFAMEGMDMGLNLFRFEPERQALWRARSVLPVCTVDRVDWMATLTVRGRDNSYRMMIPFITH